MTWHRDLREAGHLSPYVLVATAVHAAWMLFGLSRFSAGLPPREVLRATAGLLNVSLESEVPVVASAPEPPRAAPIATAEREAPLPGVRPALVRARAAPVPDRSPVDEPPAPVSPEVGGDRSQEPAADDAQATLEAVQAAVDRRQRGLEMAQAAAGAGVGLGAGRGAGGSGGGGGPRDIHGSIAFGNGKFGALTGRVCFLPVGTLRIADVHECHVVATLYTDTLDIPERHFHDGFPGVTDRSDWFLIEYTGSFTVSAYGSYAFRLHSDDGSYLYIDDQLVIDNDGKHAPASRSGSIPLVVGRHRIRVLYAQTNDRMALQLFVRAPDARTEQIFTPKL